MEDVLSAWLRASSDWRFLLVIAGRISGVHDGQGTYKPVDYQVTGSNVVIQFDGSEQLTVSNATDILMHPNGELVIGDGCEARFSWRSHVDPETARKLCEEVFTKIGRGVQFSRTGAPFATNGFFLYVGNQFIVLRRPVAP